MWGSPSGIQHPGKYTKQKTSTVLGCLCGPESSGCWPSSVPRISWASKRKLSCANPGPGRQKLHSPRGDIEFVVFCACSVLDGKVRAEIIFWNIVSKQVIQYTQATTGVCWVYTMLFEKLEFPWMCLDCLWFVWGSSDYLSFVIVSEGRPMDSVPPPLKPVYTTNFI